MTLSFFSNMLLSAIAIFCIPTVVLSMVVSKPPTTTKIGTLTVPTVGIGTIAWSSKSQNPEIDEIVNMASAPQQQPPLLLDTAERYGSNWKTALGVLGWGETESWLGQYHQKQQQQQGAARMTVATKFTPSPWRTTVQSVLDACDASRQRLGVESIDLYQLHMPDIFNSNNKNNHVYWQGLAECYHRGWVTNVGVSNYGPTLLHDCQAALEGHGGVPLASNQIAYSLLGRHKGAQATLEYCRQNDIAVLACFPLAMGLLTGKYNTPNTNKNGGRLASQKTQLERRDLRVYSRQMDAFMTVVEGIAQERQKTISQVALNYVICKGAIPIPGARTAAQARDNLGAAGWRLTPSQVQALEAAADSVGFAGFDGAGFKRASEKFVGYGMQAWALD